MTQKTTKKNKNSGKPTIATRIPAIQTSSRTLAIPTEIIKQLKMHKIIPAASNGISIFVFLYNSISHILGYFLV
uniref:Uncharacterized protein n=1 Tax=Schistosoma haematobium TaxID=6185 RepID=A0A094ZI45_SCHHA